MATIFYAQGGYDAFPLNAGSAKALYIRIAATLTILTLYDDRKIITASDGIPNLRYNERASELLGMPLFGNVVVCSEGEIPPRMLRKLMNADRFQLSRVIDASPGQYRVATMSVEQTQPTSDGKAAKWGTFLMARVPLDWVLLAEFEYKDEAIRHALNMISPVSNNVLSFTAFQALSHDVQVYSAGGESFPYSKGDFMHRSFGDSAAAYAAYLEGIDDTF
jgi:hypothetical protein